MEPSDGAIYAVGETVTVRAGVSDVALLDSLTWVTIDPDGVRIGLGSESSFLTTWTVPGTHQLEMSWALIDGTSGVETVTLEITP